MSPEPHPAIRDITLDQWNEYSVKLLAYTVAFFKNYGGAEVVLPGGYSADDIAQEIVLRVLEGSRRWNPEQHGDLHMYMIGQVRSIVDHCIHSWAGKYEYEVPEGDGYSMDEYLDSVLMTYGQEDQISYLSPEQIILNKEMVVERSELIDLLLEAASGESDLEALLEAYLDDDDRHRRRHIAIKLGITPDDVTNLWKKIKRRWNNLFREKTLREGMTNEK